MYISGTVKGYTQTLEYKDENLACKVGIEYKSGQKQGGQKERNTL